jgi:hypothetical protein
MPAFFSRRKRDCAHVSTCVYIGSKQKTAFGSQLKNEGLSDKKEGPFGTKCLIPISSPFLKIRCMILRLGANNFEQLHGASPPEQNSPRKCLNH